MSGPWVADGAVNARPVPRRTTALRIPCPWSGDENDPTPRSYAAWLRHRAGLHDWVTAHTVPPATRCTWCGKGRVVTVLGKVADVAVTAGIVVTSTGIVYNVVTLVEGLRS